MKVDKMNNIIVLKGMPSNIVEEAIVVLKPNVKLNRESLSEIKNTSFQNQPNSILKEAENVINNYMNHMQYKSQMIDTQKTEKKYKILKRMSIALGIINIFCIFQIF